jgi:hypothetical protein
MIGVRRIMGRKDVVRDNAVAEPLLASLKNENVVPPPIPRACACTVRCHRIRRGFLEPTENACLRRMPDAARISPNRNLSLKKIKGKVSKKLFTLITCKKPHSALLKLSEP